MRTIHLVISSIVLIFFGIAMLVQSFNPPIYLMFGVLTVLFVVMGIDSLKTGQKWVGSIFLVTAVVMCWTATEDFMIG
ncbi:hypothetical protein [Virgibacillus senegalensis]|uniref:hypothetical protein n=1 Tax=Virgibacillus senegalensis TaxID=1499679 RepID=UPI00069E92CA|nr:hypothetical protein [Virgibacillus senegalensis]